MLMEEFGPNYKYAKHPSPIFQSSTLAAAAQFHKTFASSDFAAGGVGPNSGFPREEKTPELLNETTRAPTVAVERRRRVYIFSLAFCVAADKSEKYPGVIFPARLQTSASLEGDPRFRCNRAGEGGFWLIPPPVNRVPQLVCKSPLLAYLKYHSLGGD